MKKKSHSKESKMSFIYYVLILMLTYVGPAYAEFEIIEEDVGEFEQSFPDRNKVADDLELHAQNDVVVGELPSGKIKIYTDKTHITTIEVDKQDCDIMRKEDNSIGLGWKFGGLMWGFGPEIKIGHSSGVEWKADVQRMVAEYQELCTQFNTGRLSQQEYQQEKEGIIKRGYNYARELQERFQKKKDDMFKEMDKGKYIHLQNARFYEGCCYYPNRVDEKHLVAEVQPQKPFELSPQKKAEAREQGRREYMQHYNKFAKVIKRKMALANLAHRDRIKQLEHSRTLCRNTGYCNGRYVDRHHRSMRNHRNEQGWNWDVYGNSNNEWDVRVERSW